MKYTCYSLSSIKWEKSRQEKHVSESGSERDRQDLAQMILLFFKNGCWANFLKLIYMRLIHYEYGVPYITYRLNKLQGSKAWDPP